MKIVLLVLIWCWAVEGTKTKTKTRTKVRQKQRLKLDSSSVSRQDGAPPSESPPPADAAKDPAEVVNQAGADLNSDEKSSSQKDIDEIINNMESNGIKLSEEQKIDIARNYMANKKSMINTQLKLYKGLKEPTKMFTEGRLDSDIPHIILENANNIPVDANDMATEKECQYKSGFLAYITEITRPQSIR